MIEVHDARQATADLEGLLRHPGWALLVDYLKDVRGSEQKVLEARSSTPTEREASAGEVRGITAAIQGPEALIKRFRGST